MSQSCRLIRSQGAPRTTNRGHGSFGHTLRMTQLARLEMAKKPPFYVHHLARRVDLLPVVLAKRNDLSAARKMSVRRRSDRRRPESSSLRFLCEVANKL